MAPLSVQLPALKVSLPAMKPEDARLIGAVAIGVAATGAAYVVVKRAGRAAGDVEITTLDDLLQYSKAPALRAVLAKLLTPSVTAVRVTGHGDRVPALPRALCSLRLLRELSVANNALTELPAELSRLTALESLDVAGNRLTSLPDSLGALTALTSLNAMGNELESLPESVGALRALRRLGLKSNRLTALPPSVGQLAALEELFLTDNLLEALPSELGACASLVKLQAAHNRLASLPPTLGALPKLELLRVACCDISAVPEALADAPALAWLSLASNPVGAKASPRRPAVPTVTLDDLELGRKLGDGASGEVFEASWRGRRVALKLFRADRSPDGHSRDEMVVACALADPHLVKVLAQLAEPLGLVMEHVEGAPLADKPTSAAPLLRCRWAAGLTLDLGFVLRVAHGVAAALEHMHHRGAAHGDVYAHNVLADGEGNAVLCDYGAAFFYAKGSPLAAAFEGQDVRAWGLMLRDLVARVDIGFEGMSAALDSQKQLVLLVQQCTSGAAATRPRFGAICRKLKSLQKAVAGAAATPRSDSRLTVKGPAANGDARAGYATAR